MSFTCPSCQQPITNRKVKKCLMCGNAIPDELLLSKEQIQKFDELARKEKVAMEKFKLDHADDLSTGGW